MNILNIDAIKCINNYIKSPIDSINFLRVIEKYFRDEHNYIHPVIHEMLIEREDFILNYHKNHIMCDSIECHEFGELTQCDICHKNLCHKCPKSENYNFINLPFGRYMCSSCYYNYCKDHELFCMFCNNVLMYNGVRRSIICNMCKTCERYSCVGCINDRSHNFITKFIKIEL